MTVTIAVINEKGGVGKTTTAITVAAGLARRGYTVALADCDPQGHVAKYLGLPDEAGLFELLVNDRPIATCSGRFRTKYGLHLTVAMVVW